MTGRFVALFIVATVCLAAVMKAVSASPVARPAAEVAPAVQDAKTTPRCPLRRAVRPDGAPLVIAHRGASGYLPEHTLAAYAAAYFMGADVLEPDVVLAGDGVLICSHDLTLDSTTDVAERFPGRARPDGKHYAIDFSLAEIKTLEKLGREGRVRMAGHRVATLDEMIGLVRSLNERTGRRVGIIPEPKSPGFHRAEGEDIERPLLDALGRHGYAEPDDGCVIQCFDLDSLRRMREDLRTRLPLAFLIGEDVDAETLSRAAEFCSALGPRHDLLIERRDDGWVERDLLHQARALEMSLYPWTFGDDAAYAGAFFAAGVDGLFTDYPDTAAAARAGAIRAGRVRDGVAGP